MSGINDGHDEHLYLPQLPQVLNLPCDDSNGTYGELGERYFFRRLTCVG